MDDRPYSDAELERYFSDPKARHSSPAGDGSTAPPAAPPPARTATGGNGAPPARPSGGVDEIRRRTGLVIRRLLIGIGVFAVAVLAWLFWLSRDLPSLEQLENPKNLLATVVYTADGEELARYYEDENRTWVPLDSISQHVIHALIATEDRDFYNHWGVHMRRTLQAPFLSLAGKTQGGSTVTQQLARNLYNEQVNFQVGDRSVIRKIKEILTAIRIERIYTKDEILEAYLNTVPFRYNAYGIEAAAQTYFNETASELQPEQAAVLVGMLAANTYYDPKRNPENSQRRRNVVLRNMVNEGFLDESYYQGVRDEPIALEFKPYSHEDNLAPHFAEFLRQWFKAWCEDHGYDPYSDGLVIHTTIDSRMQAIATEALREQAEGLQAVVDVEWGSPAGVGLSTTPDAYVRRASQDGYDRFGTWWSRNTGIVNEYIRGTGAFARLRDRGVETDAAVAQLREDADFMDSLKTVKTRLESGLLVMEPQTGTVLAWVGGRDFVADKYDHVGLARRQPGSTFKPFAYVAAFDNGYSPNYYVLDAPFSWDGWRPQNSGGGSSGGYVTLRSALANSRNIPTARVTKMVGAAEVARYAQRLGVRSPLDLTPNDPNDEPTYPNSIGLGVTDVTLLEMVTAYSTLANYGTYHEPTFVSRIEDRYGNVVAEFEPAGREVIGPSTAYTTVDVLKDVVRSGTAVGLRSRFDIGGIELAGKTGTTQNSGQGSGGSDGWFMGLNPDLVVGAWVGFNDRRITFRSSYWGQGAHTGMLIVGEFLEKLQNEGAPDLRLDPDRTFEEPPNYQPPRRMGYEGGSGIRRRSTDPNQDSDRPARDLLRRWQEREQQQQGNNDAGRIGW